MRLLLVCLGGLALVAGCSTVPSQPVEKVASTCDTSRMNRVDGVQTALLMERYWVNCPQVRGKN